MINYKKKAILFAIVLISVLRSIGTGIQTPAVNAAIPQIVPEDKLMKFNGANSTVQSLVQFATPAVAGAILSLKTIQFSLFIDIITAIVGIAILTVVSIPFAKKEDSPSTLSEMKAGIVYAVKERFIGKMLLVFGAFIFLCVPAGFLATLFVTRYYGENYWYMSLVEVIGFLGMTAGGVLIGAWGGFQNRMKTLVVGMTAFGALAIGMGAAHNFIVCVHPDRSFRRKKQWDEACNNAAERIWRTADECGIPLEQNESSKRHKNHYRKEFWGFYERYSEVGIVRGLDAHYLKELILFKASVSY